MKILRIIILLLTGVATPGLNADQVLQALMQDGVLVAAAFLNSAARNPQNST